MTYTFRDCVIETNKKSPNLIIKELAGLFARHPDFDGWNGFYDYTPENRIQIAKAIALGACMIAPRLSNRG